MGRERQPITRGVDWAIGEMALLAAIAVGGLVLILLGLGRWSCAPEAALWRRAECLFRTLWRMVGGD
ncbi:MAG: hypothetical protein AB7F08_08095 [Dongiaceae bacterium]